MGAAGARDGGIEGRRSGRPGHRTRPALRPPPAERQARRPAAGAAGAAHPGRVGARGAAVDHGGRAGRAAPGRPARRCGPRAPQPLRRRGRDPGPGESGSASMSDLERKPLYTAADLAGFDYAGQLGAPGEYPFTRGIHPTMYGGRLWTMRQFAGFGTAEDTNQRYKFLLEHGQTGLSVAFDFPTLMGYDSDHPRAEGEVGKCGVAISSLADMEDLFRGIPLDQVSTSMTINGPAALLFCFYVERGLARGLDVDAFAPRLSFFWDVHNDFFEEVAKLRAARRIWARHMRERYRAKNPRSWMMRFHCQTAGVTLTAQQPMNNVVRVAYQ